MFEFLEKINGGNVRIKGNIPLAFLNIKYFEQKWSRRPTVYKVQSYWVFELPRTNSPNVGNTYSSEENDHSPIDKIRSFSDYISLRNKLFTSIIFTCSNLKRKNFILIMQLGYVHLLLVYDVLSIVPESEGCCQAFSFLFCYFCCHYWCPYYHS